MIFTKNKPTDKMWWVEQEEPVKDGQMMFSFDKENIFYLFRDYPEALTDEQKSIFDKENPYWAKFFSDEK